MLSLDTETTGLDLHHGCQPFFVTMAGDSLLSICGAEQLFWEWDVNPLTREVLIPPEDVEHIQDILNSSYDCLILQNAKFDAAVLRIVGVKHFPWPKVRDTLLAGHLLASNKKHDLTSMASQYVGEPIKKYEDALEEACKKARTFCRTRLKSWRIAKEGMPDLPSVKKSGNKKEDRQWRNDLWLPRALAQELRYPLENHERSHWHTVLRDYSNIDSDILVPLWQAQEEQLQRRGLWKIYAERLKLLLIAYRMEERGVTVNAERIDELIKEYKGHSQHYESVCVGIAGTYGYDLKMPRSGSNDSLREFVYDVMQLEPVYNSKSKTEAPTLDAKTAKPHYLVTLDSDTKEGMFVRRLFQKREIDTTITYMQSYKRFMVKWVPAFPDAFPPDSKTGAGWYVLHPSLNPTGTDTLRWSSNNPNSQNASTKTDEEGRGARWCFGPAPGREWYDADAQNIELRIPAYEAKEEAFIALFERPNDPPYFGSNHLLIAHLLFKKEFETCVNEEGILDGRLFKDGKFKQIYKRVKNGNFAVQYGAVNRDDGMGTADKTYGFKGAQSMIEERFSRLTALNQFYVRFAVKHGYVETLPDKSVDPTRGYPLLCSRNNRGFILPTVPLNYHVQGTACWWMARAMVRCQQQLDDWRERDGFDGHITLQVHDSLVFDFPLSKTNPLEDYEAEKQGKALFRTSKSSNLWRIRILQKLMEQGGEDIGIPTPTSVRYHKHNWSEGESL